MTGNLDAVKPKIEMPTTLEIRCPRCGRHVRLSAEIAPLGSEPGHRIYHCLDYAGIKADPRRFEGSLEQIHLGPLWDHSTAFEIPDGRSAYHRHLGEQSRCPIYQRSGTSALRCRVSKISLDIYSCATPQLGMPFRNYRPSRPAPPPHAATHPGISKHRDCCSQVAAHRVGT
jgi:hypothetical protein